MLEKTVGCDNGTRLSIAHDIRMFAEELGKYYRGGRCNFSEIVMEHTNPLVPYMHTDTCYLRFADNFTAVMKNSSATHWDMCQVLNQTKHCLEKESMYLPPLLQGVWRTAAHKIDLNSCYSGFGKKITTCTYMYKQVSIFCSSNLRHNLFNTSAYFEDSCKFMFAYLWIVLVEVCISIYLMIILLCCPFVIVAEAMMKMNMTKEEEKMMAMENWNMSQLFNRTMNGKFSDLWFYMLLQAQFHVNVE